MTILASGQVAAAQADVFNVQLGAVVDAEKVTVNKITLFNTNAIEQTAVIFVKKFGSTAVKLRQFILKQNEGGEYLEPGEVIGLENGDVLQAETTTADAVDFVVFGVRS